MPTATAQIAPEEAGLERAGSQALSVFVRALNARVLRAHADGPLSSANLEERLGWAAEASLRVAIAELCNLGALEREGRQPIVTKLTPGGWDLLRLADALERWLGHSPHGAFDLDGEPGRGVVKALVAGWQSTVVQALAERPRRLADLSREVPAHSYPALKRRFVKMRTAALAVPVDGRARSPAYEATLFLCRAAGPLSLAARWERDHAPSATPLDPSDLIAALLLALPLIALPSGASGSCVLAAAGPSGSEAGDADSPTAVSLVVAKGEIALLAPSVAAAPGTWALAPAEAWLDALLDGRLDDLRLRGADADLAATVVESLHDSLSSKRP